MDQTNPKPFVFVLMPFRPEFDDIYQFGIQDACKEAGAYCERVDEQIFVEDILDRVYNQIAKADIIVAEMTGRNPNVFYETGYAHALNKRVILLTQNSDDIPFDLKHYPHIVYGGKIGLLNSELERRIRWFIDNPTRTLTTVDHDFEFLINGTSVHEGLEIAIPIEDVSFTRVMRNESGQTTSVELNHNVRSHVQVVAHNLSLKVIETSHYRLALVVPAGFQVRDEHPNSALDEKRIMIHLMPQTSLFPDERAVFDLVVGFNSKHWMPLESFEMMLRLFSELGPRDFPFRARIHPNPV